jgi:hypothetical protein
MSSLKTKEDRWFHWIDSGSRGFVPFWQQHLAAMLKEDSSLEWDQKIEKHRKIKLAVLGEEQAHLSDIWKPYQDREIKIFLEVYFQQVSDYVWDETLYLH